MAKKYIPCYNVEAPVGKGGTNRPDDVLLVQFFLTEVAKVPPHPVQPPTTPLSVNGVPTPLLNDWILWFQKSCKLAGTGFVTDSRIDPARMHGDNIYAGDGTILDLNIAYRRRFRDAHNYLEAYKDCPLPLKIKFAKDWW